MGLYRVVTGTWGTFSGRKEGNESCIDFSNFLLLLQDAIEPLLNTSSNNGACGEIGASCKARAKAETRVSSDAPVCRGGRTDDGAEGGWGRGFSPPIFPKNSVNAY